jgi:hypothetical protein
VSLRHVIAMTRAESEPTGGSGSVERRAGNPAQSATKALSVGAIEPATSRNLGFYLCERIEGAVLCHISGNWFVDGDVEMVEAVRPVAEAAQWSVIVISMSSARAERQLLLLPS